MLYLLSVLRITTVLQVVILRSARITTVLQVVPKITHEVAPRVTFCGYHHDCHVSRKPSPYVDQLRLRFYGPDPLLKAKRSKARSTTGVQVGTSTTQGVENMYDTPETGQWVRWSLPPLCFRFVYGKYMLYTAFGVVGSLQYGTFFSV